MLRHLSAACLAALLALIVVADRTSAKPPDLPDDDPIIVSTPEPTTAPVSQAVDGSFLFMIDLLPEFCREAEPERIATMPKVESECPYSSKLTDRRAVMATELKDMPGVMDNLRALQKAATEIDRAQKLVAAGKMGKAMKHLEKARKLCPGSSYARRADEVKQELDTARINELLHSSEESGWPVSEERADKTPCPVSACPTMTKIQNISACWMSQLTPYYARIECTATKCAGCCAGYCGASDTSDRPISLKFDATPLLVVSEQLSKQLCMPVRLDPIAFQMRGLSMHLPITARIENMPVSVALDVLCRPLGLEARVCDGQICITSPLIKGCGKCCSANELDAVYKDILIRVEEVSGGLMLGEGVNSDSGLTGSITLNERNFDCPKVCPSAGDAEPCESACPKCEKMHRELTKKANQKATVVNEACISLPCPLGNRVLLEAIRINLKEAGTGSLIFGAGMNSDSGRTGSIVVNGSIIMNKRNFPCLKGCSSAGNDEACESACPKCEKMHRELMKKAAESKKVAGVKEQVDGLLKACYFAVSEGRTAKAADLARQAHALDPKRVEADPLIYKLHVIVEEGQCEECETPRKGHPACPIGAGEGNLSLRPALPAIDPAIVPALDRVLMARTIGADGLDRVGVDFNVISTGNVQECEEPRDSCCSCYEIAEAVARCCMHLTLGSPPKDVKAGYVMCGLGTNGINVSSLSTHAGVKVLVIYRSGLPLIWVKYDPDSTPKTDE